MPEICTFVGLVEALTALRALRPSSGIRRVHWDDQDAVRVERSLVRLSSDLEAELFDCGVLLLADARGYIMARRMF